MGPFNLNIGVGASVEYTDNAESSETDKKSDITIALGPSVSGDIALPFRLRGGQELRVSTSFSFSYEFSLREGGSKTFGAPAAASVNLPFYLGKWSFVLGDSFSFSNEPLETTWATNRDEAKVYLNNAYASATRQFGKISTTYAVQRSDQLAPDDPEQEQTQYQFSFTPGYFFREGYSVFLRTAYVMTDAKSPNERDQRGYSADVGVSGQITPSISGSASVGWAHTHLLPMGTNTADNVDGIGSTIALSYTNPLRPNTTHGISVFRSPGVSAALNDSEVTEITGISYSIAHRLGRRMTLAPTVTWTHLKDVGGGGGEVADIISVAIGWSRSFSRHVSGSVSYVYQTRESNLPGESYDVNQVTFSAVYQF
jgi:hypothetical protein